MYIKQQQRRLWAWFVIIRIVACEPGYVAPSGFNSCTKCPTGTFQVSGQIRSYDAFAIARVVHLNLSVRLELVNSLWDRNEFKLLIKLSHIQH